MLEFKKRKITRCTEAGWTTSRPLYSSIWFIQYLSFWWIAIYCTSSNLSYITYRLSSYPLPAFSHSPFVLLPLLSLNIITSISLCKRNNLHCWTVLKKEKWLQEIIWKDSCWIYRGGFPRFFPWSGTKSIHQSKVMGRFNVLRWHLHFYAAV